MLTLTVEPSIIRYLVKVRIGNAYLNFVAGKISLSCKLGTAAQEQDISAVHFVEVLKYLRKKKCEKIK